jgi:hypothetical protein
MKSTKLTRPRARLSGRHVRRWLEWRDTGYPKTAARASVDPRLLTIGAAFESVIAYSWRYLEADDQLLADLAKFSLDTSDPRTHVKDDGTTNPHHAAVMVDWAVRCVFPLHYERLPDRFLPRETSVQFRQLSRVLWPTQTSAALRVLTPVWLTLYQTDRGTEEERGLINAALHAAQETMIALAGLLDRQLHAVRAWGQGPIRDGILHARALSTLKTTFALTILSEHDRRTAAEALPQLISVLRQVRSGDSHQTVKNRCVWRAPALNNKRQLSPSPIAAVVREAALDADADRRADARNSGGAR